MEVMAEPVVPMELHHHLQEIVEPIEVVVQTGVLHLATELREEVQEATSLLVELLQEVATTADLLVAQDHLAATEAVEAEALEVVAATVVLAVAQGLLVAIEAQVVPVGLLEHLDHLEEVVEEEDNP